MKQTVRERRERDGEREGGVPGWRVEEGADKSFYWKQKLCQWLQPANDSCLSTAVTGKQVRALSCRSKKGIFVILYVGCT